MPDFRRGAAAVQESLDKAKSGGGDFKPFVPNIFWTDPEKDADNSERYIMFLNPIEDIPKVDLIDYVPAGSGKRADGSKYTRFDQVIARTDPAIGEEKDPMVETWDAEPKEKLIAVAVELEPTFTEVKGRKRPTGFAVLTNSFERRIRDEKGDLTEETEEVTTPVVGFVTQSPHNFFNLVTSFDQQNAPIEETAIKVSRLDSKTYKIDGYEDQTVDLTDLIDYIEGISYLSEEDLDELLNRIDESESAQDAALAIGALLLDVRLNELADSERYDELFEGIDEPFRKFGGGGKKTAKKAAPKRDRPARRSQRRSASTEESGDSEATEPVAGDKPARRSRTAKETDDKPLSPAERIARLKEKADKHKKATA
jgi:hypothetical protein